MQRPYDRVGIRSICGQDLQYFKEYSLPRNQRSYSSKIVVRGGIQKGLKINLSFPKLKNLPKSRLDRMEAKAKSGTFFPKVVVVDAAPNFLQEFTQKNR